MRRAAALLIALLALAGLAGCGDEKDDVATGDGDDPAATEPDGFNDPLLDRELTVTGATGHQIVDGTTITLSFDGSTVGVDAGCNQLSGTYTWDGDDLVVEALGGTEMGCDPERMEQDAWISAFLAEGPTVLATEDGTVTLTAGDEVVTLTDQPVADAVPLTGTTWVLDTIIESGGPDGTASSLPAGVTAQVTFADDGTYAVEAGCNTGTGTYEHFRDEIYLIDGPTLTRRTCPDEVMDVEYRVYDGLNDEVAVSIVGDRLTIEAMDGTVLGFVSG
jgi:heat shock protein HslJ